MGEIICRYQSLTLDFQPNFTLYSIRKHFEGFNLGQLSPAFEEPTPSYVEQLQNRVSKMLMSPDVLVSVPTEYHLEDIPSDVHLDHGLMEEA